MGEKKLYPYFVDFEKAFDTVWHKGLFKKLHNYGISGKCLDLIFSLYNKTRCAIKKNGQTTEFFAYEKGVRQGCPLSALLALQLRLNPNTVGFTIDGEKSLVPITWMTQQ